LFGVVAFSIDRRDFAAHGAQIGGELPAMVDGVTKAEVKESDGGKLEGPAEINNFGGLFASESREPFKIFGEGFFVPFGDAVDGESGGGAGDGVEVEGAGDDAAIETMLGGGDVPSELDGGLRLRVGAIVGVGGGDGGDDGAGGAVLVLHRGKLVLQKERGLIWRDGIH